MRITSKRVLDVKEEMCICFTDWQRILIELIGPNCLKCFKILKLTAGNVD